MTDRGATWRVELVVPSVDHVPVFEAALESLGAAVTALEIDADGARGSGRWRVIGYGLDRADTAELEARFALAAAGAGIEPPSHQWEMLTETDWVAEARRDVAPIDAGRFFVHASHHEGSPPGGKIAVQVDASMAFGSGEHASTRGCLIAMDRLLDTSVPGSVLDMGSGSGILAIAVAKAGASEIVAADNDPGAVEIACENARINGVAERIRMLVSDGFEHQDVGRAMPYDWILANILAGPLVDMASPLVGHLRVGGTAVLSGFLREQAGDVADAYRRRGAGGDRPRCHRRLGDPHPRTRLTDATKGKGGLAGRPLSFQRRERGLRLLSWAPLPRAPVPLRSRGRSSDRAHRTGSGRG